MPRKPRHFRAHIPCHVVQRGHNQSLCYFSDYDFYYYLECLENACRKYQVAVHAYALLPNQAHLLLTPEDTPGIPRVMQSLGRTYVQYYNRKYNRSGALWDDRYKSSVIPDKALLPCQTSIEFIPVSTGLIQLPNDYPWSSHRCYAYGEETGLLTCHAAYLELGADPEGRRRAYRNLFSQPIFNLGHDMSQCNPISTGRSGEDGLRRKSDTKIMTTPTPA